MRKLNNSGTLLISAAVIMLTLSMCGNSGNKNDKILEIIALYLPDSVVFKPVEEKKDLNVFGVSLVSNTDTLQAGELGSSATFISDGSGVQSVRDHKYCARKFNSLAGFEPQKIIFVVDGKEIVYNIANAKWE